MTSLEVGRFAVRVFGMHYFLDYGPPIVVSVSIGERGGWENGVCTARCVKPTGLPAMGYTPGGLPHWQAPLQTEHEAPHIDCRCGIYGCLSLDQLMRGYGSYAKRLTAVIAPEGKTIIGDKGLRTQYARVVAYWYGSQDHWEGHWKAAAIRAFPEATSYQNIRGMLADYKIPIALPNQKICRLTQELVP